MFLNASIHKKPKLAEHTVIPWLWHSMYGFSNMKQPYLLGIPSNPEPLVSLSLVCSVMVICLVIFIIKLDRLIDPIIVYIKYDDEICDRVVVRTLLATYPETFGYLGRFLVCKTGRLLVNIIPKFVAGRVKSTRVSFGKAFSFPNRWPNQSICKIWLSSRHCYPPGAATKSRNHYSDVMMGAMASQIASLTIVYSIVYSDAGQRKHLSSVSLASNAENVPIWWRHHDSTLLGLCTKNLVSINE